MQERSLPMEPNHAVENMWRIWVDTKRRIVSFHEEEGCQMLEFRNHDMFLSCVDQYSGKQYRYQEIKKERPWGVPFSRAGAQSWT